jgi:hypothetical protein
MATQAKFYNDRRPRPSDDGDASVVLDKASVTQANRHIMACTPDHRSDEMRTRIRTAAVQRFRAREDGRGDFQSIEEYKNFVYGTGE